jgi:ankyrin repeat protein
LPISGTSPRAAIFSLVSPALRPLLAHVRRNKSVYLHWIQWINRLTLVPTLLFCLLSVYLAQTNKDDAERYLWQGTIMFTSADEGAIRAALCSGADINCRGYEGATYLLQAAELGNLDYVRILVKLGADVTLRDDNGNTASDVAKRNGHTAIVQFLHKHGGI